MNSLLTKAFGKALLASKIILKIAEQPINLQQLRRYSLTEQIKKLIQENQKKYSFIKSSNSSNQMLKYFDQGINLNTGIFNHQGLHKGFSDKQFVFHPSFLITGQIFRTVLNVNQRIYFPFHSFYTGHYGISKTISYMLLWHLSNKVNLYRYKFYNQFVDQSIESKLQKQIIDIDKVFYVSYYKQHFKGDLYPKFENYLNKTINLQCKQQLQNSKASKTSNDIDEVIFDDLSQVKQKYNKKNIKTTLIVDHVHEYLSQIKELKDNMIYDNEKIKNLGRHNSIFYQSIADKIIYLSSVNILKKLVLQANFTGNQNHSEPQFHRIQFPQLLNRQSTIIQMVDYFLFELFIRFKEFQSFYKSSLIIEQNNVKKKLKTNLIVYLKKISQQYMLFSQTINRFFKQQQTKAFLLQIIEKCKQSPITQQQKILDLIVKQLQMLFKKTIKYAGKDLCDKIKEFIQKQDSLKKRKYQLIYELYLSSFQIQDNLKKSRNYPPLIYQYRIPLTNPQIFQDLEMNSIDKHLFYISGTTAYSLFPPILLRKFLKPHMSPVLKYLFQRRKQEIIQFINSAGLGMYIQQILIFFLTIRNVQWNLNFSKFIPSPKAMGYASKLSFDNIEKLQNGFLPIPQTQKVTQQSDSQNNQSKIKNDGYYFLDSFQKYYLYLLQNKLKFHQVHRMIFRPLKIGQFDEQLNIQKFWIDGISQSQVNHISKKLNFILGTISREYLTLKLFAFDVTKDEKQVKQKFKIFVQNFVTIFKDWNRTSIHLQKDCPAYRVELHYYVIGPTKTPANSDELDQYLNNYLIEIKSNDKIYFQSSNAPSNIIGVKSKDQSSQSLLKSVGYISMVDQMQLIDIQKPVFGSNDESRKQVMFLKYLIEEQIKKEQKKAKQN